jgi:hypothetical protein
LFGEAVCGDAVLSSSQGSQCAAGSETIESLAAR